MKPLRFLPISVFWAGVLLTGLFSCEGAVTPKFGAGENVRDCLRCHTSYTVYKHGRAGCLDCHGPSSPDSESPLESVLHDNLIKFPGELSRAEQTCGACHGEHVKGVLHSPMSTGAGMVEKTRRVFEDLYPGDREFHITRLDHKNRAADSYMAQLCASCHLHRAKSASGVLRGDAKGGGCLACHLRTVQVDAHPDLGATESDRVCFNCHSRSGRISLNYSGLAELTSESDLSAGSPGGHPSQILPDGRTVYKLESDVHFRAGIRCQDCHSGRQVMGMKAKNEKSGKDSVRCVDCHKLTPDQDHRRLSCESCHTRWAPTCFGCHIEFEPGTNSFNHITGTTEPGAWREFSSEFRAELPALGVRADGKIAPFIPGMKLSIDKSRFSGLKNDIIEKNIFVDFSAHTIGRSRSCLSCHFSGQALGFGRGELSIDNNGRPTFRPVYRVGQFGVNRGVSEDGWIKPFGLIRYKNGSRSLTPEEQRRVLKVGIDLKLSGKGSFNSGKYHVPVQSPQK